jgi:hypothetical protein
MTKPKMWTDLARLHDADWRPNQPKTLPTSSDAVLSVPAGPT